MNSQHHLLDGFQAFSCRGLVQVETSSRQSHHLLRGEVLLEVHHHVGLEVKQVLLGEVNRVLVLDVPLGFHGLEDLLAKLWRVI